MLTFLGNIAVSKVNMDNEHFILEQSWHVLTLAKWTATFALDKTVVHDTGKCVMQRIGLARFAMTWLVLEVITWICASGGAFAYWHQSNSTSFLDVGLSVAGVVAVTTTDAFSFLGSFFIVAFSGLIVAIANWVVSKDLIQYMSEFCAVSGYATWISGPIKLELANKTLKYFYL